MSMTVVKWMSLPVLLTGSLFARASVLAVLQRAVSIREYLWAAVAANVAVVFSPLTLAIKIFLLLSFTSVGALAGVYAAWKPQPVESR